MSNDETSQTHKTFSFFNDIVEEQFEQADAWLDEMQEWQKKGFERTEKAIDEAADLGKTTLDYAQRLSEEWRELSMQTFRQTTETLRTDE